MAVKIFLFDRSRAALEETLSKRADDTDEDRLRLGNLIDAYAHESFVPGDDEGYNNPWSPVGPDGEAIRLPDDGVDLGFGVPLVLPDRETARELLSILEPARSTEEAQVACSELVALTAELAPEGQHWCAGAGGGFSFGTRSAMRRLIGADSLQQHGLHGREVNVLVVDQGLNRQYIQRLGGLYAGGIRWLTDNEIRMPGEENGPYLPVQRRHGGMLLRSVIDLAPESAIFDLPLIPRRITSGEFFGLNAVFAFWIVRLLTKVVPGNWVILNAWGLVDRFAETVRGDYSNNRNHWLNVLLASLGRQNDVVFAAGNSGQFCGDNRATGYDLGPGRSIFGANGLPEIFCTGAVRTDGMWIGAASQGPGPSDFADGSDKPVMKPDLVVPSWFDEDHDAALRSGGTSSAAAVLAGTIAALRSHETIAAFDPSDLRAALRTNARPTNGPGWSERTGIGILNVETALPALLG